MWTTPDLFRVVSVALAAVLGAVLVRDHRQDPSARATLALLVATCGHMLLHMFEKNPELVVLTHTAALFGVAIPFLFWFLTKVHFDDEARLEPHHVLLLAALVATRYTGWRVAEGLMPTASESMRVFWGVMPRLFGIAFVVHALLNVYVGTRSDLVLPRLRLRYGVLGVVGTYVLLELSTQAFFAGRPQGGAAEDLHGYAGGLLLLGIGFVAFRLQPEILRPARVPAEPVLALDPRLVERLRELIEAERVYRQEGLTVAGLAQRLGTQEARLRLIINAQLGFKNFNAFLHHYRVGEARRSLADPGQRHRSVAEIAYEVGYASLGPFNRAFKELTGATPTEFRGSPESKKLAESGIGEASPAKQGDG
jgi:AraC-like DNA-binding protein